MTVVRHASQFLCGVLLLAGGAWVSAQQAPTIPYEPPKQFGTSITGAFEGWFDSADGTHNFLVGYFNRNLKQAMDVPIGPNNRIEPGGPDMGQPTHFMPHRRTGVFVVPVPKTFTADQKLTWTITVNGQTTQIPLRLHRDYNVNPFSEVAVGNTPPIVKLAANGVAIQGPVALLGKAPTVTATVGTPLTLSASVDDDGKFASATMAPVGGNRSPVNLRWTKYRGPGGVTFEAAEPRLQVTKGGEINKPFSGTGTTTAKFSAPGDYALQLLATDYSGEGGNGEVCCWTNAYLKVTVK
ncbi:MAG: hypothetical protein JNL48_14075 [Acidobacteria bacterium]|nr:hypothetical protein [Acidobacteriota bacterium]